MIFFIENIVWIVCIPAALGALCGILELALKGTRGILASVSLLFNVVSIVLAFIGGMELLTLVAIILAEFLILAVAYAIKV